MLRVAMIRTSGQRAETAQHLSTVLTAPILVAGIDAMPGGSFRASTQTWAAYWQALSWLRDARVDQALEALRVSWEAYISSGFDRALARPYSYRYFVLLTRVRTAEEGTVNKAIWRRGLQKVHAFECFPIRGQSIVPSTHAAGTTTLRNPCYLLSRLKSPEEQDNVMRLPLVTIDDEGGTGFFHYRQFPLLADPPLSVLALLPNDERRRAAGLRVIGALGHALHATADPYVQLRARRLWMHVVRPLQEHHADGTQTAAALDLLDVGAGSGRLTEAILWRFVQWCIESSRLPSLRLWFIDSAGQDPTPRFYSRSLHRFVRGAQFLSSDYRAWLAGRRQHLPRPIGMRVAVASKVFDLFSKVSIDRVSTDVLALNPRDKSALRTAEYSPQSCLRPGGSGADALITGSVRVACDGGHVYPQVSLSEFFGSLVRVAVEPDELEEKDNRLLLPVRKFEPQSLITADGGSVVMRLMGECDYLIVEDQDTQSEDLAKHLRQFSVNDLGVLDMTNSMGLSSNYSYLFWHRQAGRPPVDGITLL